MTASSPRRRARIVAGSLLVVGALALSACSAGQETQTSRQVAAVQGAQASACPGTGQCSVALRDLTVAYNDTKGYAAGADAPLVVRLISTANTAVSLVGATSDAAQAVVLSGGSGGQAPQVTGEAATASPGAAAATGQPAGQSNFSVAVPPAGYTLLVPGSGPYLLLSKLKAPLAPGQAVPVTFTFSDGSTVDVSIPMAVPTEPAPRSPLPINETGE